MRKGKPKGDGTRLETGRDHPSGGARALRVRLPLLPPASRGIGPMARHLASNQAIRGSNSPIPHSKRRLMRPWPSGQARASQARQAGSTPAGALGNRLTGRLPDFESGGGGSNSSFPNPGQLLVVVTPPLNAEAAGSIPAPGTRV